MKRYSSTVKKAYEGQRCVLFTFHSGHAHNTHRCACSSSQQTRACTNPFSLRRSNDNLLFQDAALQAGLGKSRNAQRWVGSQDAIVAKPFKAGCRARSSSLTFESRGLEGFCVHDARPSERETHDRLKSRLDDEPNQPVAMTKNCQDESFTEHQGRRPFSVQLAVGTGGTFYVRLYLRCIEAGKRHVPAVSLGLLNERED